MASTGTLTTKRKTLNQPQWTHGGVFEQHALNMARTHAWRMPFDYDEEDLLQIGWMVFHRVQMSYPYVTEPKHLMYLFSLALLRQFHTMSRIKWSRKEVHAWVTNDSGEEVDLLDTVADERFSLGDAELNALLHDAPDHLWQVIMEIVTPPEPPAYLRPERLVPGNRFRKPKVAYQRETTEAYLARLAGIEPREGLTQELLAFITGEEIINASVA